MKIIRAKDYDELSRKAANVIAAQVIVKPRSVLGLATGSSPVGLYKELVARYKLGDLDFSGIRSWNLDEYVGLTPDHDQSYHYFMYDNLFNHVNARPENIHVPNGLWKNPEADCAAYDAEIVEAGGVDLQLLGMGTNGHIGFNEPDEVFTRGTHIVDLAETTINDNKRFFASAADVPKQAFSMGIGTIMCARKILVVVSGENKAQAVKNACFGPITPKVPGSILQLHPDVTMVCDEAALSVCGDLVK